MVLFNARNVKYGKIYPTFLFHYDIWISINPRSKNAGYNLNNISAVRLNEQQRDLGNCLSDGRYLVNCRSNNNSTGRICWGDHDSGNGNKNKAEDDSAAAIADCDDNKVEHAGFDCFGIAVNDIEADLSGILGLI